MAGKEQKDMLEGGGPGVGVPSIPEIDDAANEYIKWRDKRLEIQPKEIAAKKNLLALMHAHEKTLGRTPENAIVYPFGDKVVKVTTKEESLKVVDLEEIGRAHV